MLYSLIHNVMGYNKSIFYKISVVVVFSPLQVTLDGGFLKQVSLFCHFLSVAYD
jgi:hypothetical protein